jgi:hypothetical protein
MTKSSIDPNGNTCYPEKPTSECLPKTIFPRSIFISSKAVLYRISTDLPVSIKIRCILWLAMNNLNTKVSVHERDTTANSSENPMIWVSHFVDYRGFCTKYNSKSFIFLALALRAEWVYQLLL